MTLFERLIELSSSEKVDWDIYTQYCTCQYTICMLSWVNHSDLLSFTCQCLNQPVFVLLSPSVCHYPSGEGKSLFCMCSLLQLWSKRHINMLYLMWPLNNTNPIPLAWLSRTNLISISQYHTPTVVKRLASLLEMLVELNEWWTID